ASMPMPDQSSATAPEPVAPVMKPAPSVPKRRSEPRVKVKKVVAQQEPDTSDTQSSPPPPPPDNSMPSSSQAAPPRPPPAPKKVTIPSGTSLSIRLVDELDSETAQDGQSFKATLDAPLSVDGETVIPAGYEIQGHVIEVKSAGKFAGKSVMALQLDRIRV